MGCGKNCSAGWRYSSLSIYLPLLFACRAIHAYVDTQVLAETLRVMAANGLEEALAPPIVDQEEVGDRNRLARRSHMVAPKTPVLERPARRRRARPQPAVCDQEAVPDVRSRANVSAACLSGWRWRATDGERHLLEELLDRICNSG